MPDWNPPPPIVFDRAAADAAIDEASRAANLVETLLGAEEQAATSARADWHGRVRDHTDQWLDMHTWAMHHSLERLRALSRDLHGAVDQAAAAELRRSHLVQQWSTERAAELAAERLLLEDDAVGGR